MTYPRIRDPRTGRLRKATPVDETVLRFNWGYHDGAGDYDARSQPRPDGLTVSTIREQHYDPAYAEGYVSGWHDARDGAYSRSSQPAWERESHRASLAVRYATYRIKREMREP